MIFSANEDFRRDLSVKEYWPFLALFSLETNQLSVAGCQFFSTIKQFNNSAINNSAIHN
jgi:hypothetical protein